MTLGNQPNSTHSCASIMGGTNLPHGERETCPGTLGSASLVLEDDVQKVAVVDGARVASVGLSDELAQLEGGLGLAPLLEHDVELECLQRAALVGVILHEGVPELLQLLGAEVLPELKLHQTWVVITDLERHRHLLVYHSPLAAK